MATRADYRLAAMKLLGDVTELEATAETDASSFEDELNLYKENGTLVGRILYVVSQGTNFGLARRVASNDKETSRISLSRPLDAAVTVGTQAQLYNFRDQGVTMSMVNSAINFALNSVGDDYGVPVYEDVSGTFDYMSPVITIPSTIKAFSEIAFRDPNTLEWIDIPIMQRYVDQWARTVTITGDALVYMADKSVRIKGYGRPGSLTDDTTDSPVDLEWMGYQVASNLCFELARRRMDPQTNERWGQYWGDKADERRTKVTQPHYGFAIPLYG